MNKCPICNIGSFKVYEGDYNYESYICLNCAFHYAATEKGINFIKFNYNFIYRIYYHPNSFSI